MRYRFRGVEYPEAEKLTFAEMGYMERLVKEPSSEWPQHFTIAASIFLSIRRVDPKCIGWEEFLNVPYEEIDIVPEPDDDAARGAEPGSQPQESNPPAEGATEPQDGDSSGAPEHSG